VGIVGGFVGIVGGFVGIVGVFVGIVGVFVGIVGALFLAFGVPKSRPFQTTIGSANMVAAKC
jgi:hypothetical protein